MLKERFSNKKVAVLGMGMEGVAVAEFLLENEVSKVALLDRVEESELIAREPEDKRPQLSKLFGNDRVSKYFGGEYLKTIKEYDVIFRTPGVSAFDPAILQAQSSGAEITSQIKLFFDLAPCQIIGVTGTKGKGTTATLIRDILKRAGKDVYLAGNIGAPAISLVPELSSDSVAILELSSFQLMDLHKSPHIAVLVNLEVDHLDYHKDVSEYQEAKFNILKYQTGSDFAILNQDSTFSQAKLAEVKSKIKYFSYDPKADAVVGEKNVILDPNGHAIEICELRDLHVFGRHNLANIAAAALVADTLEIPTETIRSATKDFRGLPYRIEYVATVDGVKFINDSFATNPEPTLAAIRSFSENKVLILGGSSKGADFDILAQEIAKSNVKKVVLIGVEGNKIKESLDKAGYADYLMANGDISDIVLSAKNEAESGDVVIFSPACASFDMFKNYKDRGEKFKNVVLSMSSEKPQT